MVTELAPVAYLLIAAEGTPVRGQPAFKGVAREGYAIDGVAAYAPPAFIMPVPSGAEVPSPVPSVWRQEDGSEVRAVIAEVPFWYEAAPPKRYVDWQWNPFGWTILCDVDAASLQQWLAGVLAAAGEQMPVIEPGEVWFFALPDVPCARHVPPLRESSRLLH